MSKINYKSVTAGLFGGSASCIAKLALAPDAYVPTFFRSLLCTQDNIERGFIELIQGGDYVCGLGGVLPRVVLMLCMIGLNLVMLGTFLEGMNESGSVIATALSTGANFTISAFYGILLFEEEINYIWCCGFTMILLGVYLLSSVSIKAKEHQS